MKTRFYCTLLMLALPVLAFGLAGTMVVARSGQKFQEPPLLGWPQGVMELVNDPARTVGLHPFFSELPNDTYHFAFEITRSADLNRLLRKMASIHHDEVTVLISPTEGAPKIGYGATGGKEAEGSAVIFFLGSQSIIDSWYSRLPETKPGVKQFGAHTYTAAPTARPPTLWIFSGHPAVNPSEMEIPQNLKVIRN